MPQFSLGPWQSLFWLVTFLVPLLFMKGWINRHVQGVGLLLLGEGEQSLLFYYLLLFPGILLHELSHWIAATMLGVRTGGISLGPKVRSGGQVRLGSVRVARTDPIRDSLVGLAPLIMGSLAILSIAFLGFGLSMPSNVSAGQQLLAVVRDLPSYVRVPDLWVWVYLIFAISNAMLPSESDRRPWLSLLLYLGILIVLFFSMTGGTELPEPVTEGALRGADYLGFAFGVTILVDSIMMIVIRALEELIGVLRGERVKY